MADIFISRLRNSTLLNSGGFICRALLQGFLYWEAHRHSSMQLLLMCSESREGFSWFFKRQKILTILKLHF